MLLDIMDVAEKEEDASDSQVNKTTQGLTGNAPPENTENRNN